MIHRRAVLPALVLLVLVVFGLVARIAGGSATKAPGAPTATPTPTAAVTGAARDVVRAVGAVETAFNRGDVQRLCRPGDLVDPAVLRQQNAEPGGCESELELLMANEPPMRLTVRSMTLRAGVVNVDVTTVRGASTSVDLVPRGRTWLLSFSDGDDPFSALAGAG